jgi:hypothetical protein
MERQIADSSLLTQRFDEAVVTLLKPYFDSKGAAHTKSGYVVGPSGKFADVAPSLPDGYKRASHHFFLWIHRFQIGDVAFGVMYGDREFEIAPQLSLGEWTFALGEIRELLNLEDRDGFSPHPWVLDEDGISRSITQIADAVIPHWDVLSALDESARQEAIRRRNARAVEARKAARIKEGERASIHAADAFHSGQYASVLQQLSPFEEEKILPESAMRMLKISRARQRK